MRIVEPFDSPSFAIHWIDCATKISIARASSLPSTNPLRVKELLGLTKAAKKQAQNEREKPLVRFRFPQQLLVRLGSLAQIGSGVVTLSSWVPGSRGGSGHV